MMRGLSLPAIHKHIKVLNRRPLQQLQNWVGQFHPYWDSDQATFENYDQYLGITRNPRHTEPSPNPR